jgi:hypothetical protein
VTDRRSHPEASHYIQDTPLTPPDVRRLDLSPTGQNSTSGKKGVFFRSITSICADSDPESDDDHMYESDSVSSDISLRSDELDILEEAYDEFFAEIGSQPAEAENTESEGHSAATAADQETDPVHSEQTKRSTSQNTSTREVHSIAHEFFEKDQIVLLSIDLEHGGPTGGILQLSVVAFMPSGEHLGEFNKYIEPPSGAVISSNSTVIHGLSMNDPRIQSAQSIEQVCSQFISFCESFLTEEQKRDVFIVWGIPRHPSISKTLL